MLLNWGLCSASWILYSLEEGSLYVLFSNIVGLLSSIISIGQKYYYGKPASTNSTL